jgi:hypothetical protein
VGHAVVSFTIGRLKTVLTLAFVDKNAGGTGLRDNCGDPPISEVLQFKQSKATTPDCMNTKEIDHFSEKS